MIVFWDRLGFIGGFSDFGREWSLWEISLRRRKCLS